MTFWIDYLPLYSNILSYSWWKELVIPLLFSSSAFFLRVMYASLASPSSFIDARFSAKVSHLKPFLLCLFQLLARIESPDKAFLCFKHHDTFFHIVKREIQCRTHDSRLQPCQYLVPTNRSIGFLYYFFYGQHCLKGRIMNYFSLNLDLPDINT